MNITLILVIIIFILKITGGYKRGMAKEISGLVALVMTLLTLALVIMLFSSFEAGETTNTFYSLLLLVILGIVYGVVKLLLKSARAVSHLPILSFFDHVLGMATGIIKAVLLIWILFMLCAGNYLGPVTSIIRDDIQSSTFLKLIYSYNIFLR